MPEPLDEQQEVRGRPREGWWLARWPGAMPEPVHCHKGLTYRVGVARAITHGETLRRRWEWKRRLQIAGLEDAEPAP